MNLKLKSPEMDQLFIAILALEDLDECYAFFEDACTVNELLSIAQRFEVAKLLSEDVKYQDICQRTGASSATISRVGRALHYGQEGYAKAIERLHQMESQSEQE
ncbi:MAG: TrpR YerC/YecD [Firmicutes bacterium]|nr:TrpR YerC/YecD [Bacillota bacterium]